MAGLFKAVGALLDAVTTTAQVVNTTANAGLALAQGAQSAAISYRNTAILQMMEETGLSTGDPEKDISLYFALLEAEQAEEKKGSKLVKAPATAQ